MPRKPPNLTLDIGGHEWQVHFVRRGHPQLVIRGKVCIGACYQDSREIFVRYDLSETTVVDTLIHEILHASNELLFYAEMFVTDTATVAAETVMTYLQGNKDVASQQANRDCGMYSKAAASARKRPANKKRNNG